MPSDPRDPIPPGGVRVDHLIEEARRNAAEKLRADAKPPSPATDGMPNWFSNEPIQPSDPGPHSIAEEVEKLRTWGSPAPKPPSEEVKAFLKAMVPETSNPPMSASAPKNPTPEPPTASGIHPIADFFRKEWGTVKNAPFFFTMCVLVGAGAAYWLVDHLYSAELRAKDATIQTLSLRPESIPAQEQEIAFLKSQLEILQSQTPKRYVKFTDTQIETWVKALEPFHLKTMVLLWSSVNGEQILMSLVEVGKRGKFQVGTGTGYATDQEIEIVTAKGEPAAQTLVSLFKTINNRVKLEEGGNADVPAPQLGTVLVFLGEKQ